MLSSALRHTSDLKRRFTTYLRNTTTTTIAATTRRNAAPPITEPTSRGRRFWICCECSSEGEKVRSLISCYVCHDKAVNCAILKLCAKCH